MLFALGFGLLATGAQAQNLDLLKEGAKIKLVLSSATCDVRVTTRGAESFRDPAFERVPGLRDQPECCSDEQRREN